MDQKAMLVMVKEALSEKIHVRQIYLFGSRAKGSFRNDSDYDFAIVSPDFEGMPFLKRQQLVRPVIRKALGTVPLDVVCYTPEEFRRGSKAFLPRIIGEEGIAA